jgi:hypothetical protein
VIVSPPAVRLRLLALGALALLPVAGCGATPPAKGAGAVPPAGDQPPAARLAAKAALAQDLRYSAQYRFGRGGTLRVTRAAGGFSLELTESGATRTAITTTGGSFRCSADVCVRGARAGDDPLSRLQDVFTTWLRVLADRSAALSITEAQPPQDATGTCFSVQGVAAALEPPVDPGLYCFDDRGMVTAAQLPAGSLILERTGPAPDELALPAPVGPSPSAAGSPAAPASVSPAPGVTPTS